MTIRPIRSRTHRKILHCLMDGPATVSDLAQWSNMKLPHMSLGCKQLREMGQIQRDDVTGIRKAPHRLTQLGVERVRSDMVHHMLKSKFGMFPSKFDAVIIKIEGSKVLIGYTKQPKNHLHFIPNKGYEQGDNPSNTSKGNAGGTWISIHGSRIGWYNATDGTSTSPETPAKGTLIEFQHPEKKIGLAWGNIIRESHESHLSEKTWFNSKYDESETLDFSLGDYYLGKIDHEIPFQIHRGTHAIITSSIERELLIQKLARKSRTAVSLQNRQTKMPFNVIVEWVKLIHPRLDYSKVESKASDLFRRIKDKKMRPSKILNELRNDFQNVDWVKDSEGDFKHISIAGCSERGSRAVAEFLLTTTTPWVLEWNYTLPKDNLLERCISYQHCVCVITKQVEDAPLINAQMVLRSTANIGEIDVRTSRLGTFSFHLDTYGDEQKPQQLQFIPRNAEELIKFQQHYSTQKGKTLELDSEFQTPTIHAALQCYPDGDTDLANSVERQEPLASWISSPMEERPKRWERIHDKLPPGWVELQDMTLMSDEMLLKSSMYGGKKWIEEMLLETKLRCLNHPMFLLKLFEAVDDEEIQFHAAAIILCSVDFIDVNYRVKIEHAFEKWIQQPIFSLYVLEMVFQTSTFSEEEKKKMFEHLISVELEGSEFPIFSTWQKYHRSNKEQLSLEFIQLCIDIFPSHWWRKDSLHWFNRLSSSKSGRDWLSKQHIPWSIQLLSQNQRRWSVPGVDVEIGDLQSIDIMNVERVISNSEFKNQHLTDLYQILLHREKSGIPRCKTHPLLGWLSKPVERWPLFSSSSFLVDDSYIGQHLFKMYVSKRLE